MNLRDFPLDKNTVKALHTGLDDLIKQVSSAESEASTLHISVPFTKDKKQMYFTFAVTLSPYMPRLDGK